MERKRDGDEIDVTDVVEVPRPFGRLSNEQMTPLSGSGISFVTSTAASPTIRNDEKIANRQNVTGNDIASTRQQGFEWILAPLSQKFQFSPQTFFHDRLGQLKDTLSQFGSIFPNQQNNGSKQLLNNGLVNIAGLNDSGFYTNRLDPVGFFGGNGWLANKGGILGGPGAIVSTGSLLTDYPTAYRK